MSKRRELLKVEDLRVSFAIQGGRVDAVKGVSFTVHEGDVVALVGESGSGKSVIAQSILRILPANGRIDGGHIWFSDPAQNGGEPVDLAAYENRDPYLYEVRGGRISMVFQEPMTALSPLHTVGSQVEEALTLHHNVSAAEARAETEEILRLVGFPNPARGYSMYSFELSGGLRQRAVIAMALICNPAMVIADEPTTALDVTVQAQILGLMKSLKKRFNTSILLITHDLGVVANMADEVVVVYHGEVMEAGPVEAIFNKPKHVYLKALMAAVPHFDMKKGERLVSLRDMGKGEEGAGSKAARSLIEKFKTQKKASKSDGPHLSVRNLRKEFTTRSGSWFGGADNTVVAVNDVSFDIMRGECFGLVGESGCGKTTVSKLIMRALEATAGDVRLNTEEGLVDVLTLQDEGLMAFRRKVQMIFQDPFSSLNPRMTVQNILREPYEIHDIMSSQERRDEIVSLMTLVGLDPRSLNRYPHSFSGGQRQRIGIARALALHPEVMICDEPVSALDVSVQAQILNLLNDLRKELGLTSMFISHNLAVVNYVAERIAVMCRGRIVEMAPRQQLFERPMHPYTKTLLASVPYPDLDRLLDFEKMTFENASDPSHWSGAYIESSGGKLANIEVDTGHYVLANTNTDFRELTE